MTKEQWLRHRQVFDRLLYTLRPLRRPLIATVHGIYTLVDGFSGSILAFRVRPDKGLGWMLFSGVMGVLLGIMRLKEWPVSGLWAVGTLVGINMIFADFSIIAIGSAAKGVAKRLT